MYYNDELFSIQKKQKVTKNAFFNYVGQITNKNIMEILLIDDRFTDIVIDSEKVYSLRLGLKYKKRKVFRKKYKCPLTNRQRGNLRFFGNISRFQLKELVCEGQFLIGITRSGW